MGKQQSIFLNNFTGGLATRMSEFNMPIKYSNKMDNCEVSEKGHIVKSKGYLKINTNNPAGYTTYQLTNGYEYIKKNGTKIKIIGLTYNSSRSAIYSLVSDTTFTDKGTIYDTINKLRFYSANDTLYIPNAGTFIYGTTDALWSWTQRVMTEGMLQIRLSSTGQYQICSSFNGNVYVSSNYGVTWSKTKDLTSPIYGVCISDSGQYQTFGESAGGYIWSSSDYGATWTQRGISANWYGFAMDATGQYQLGSANNPVGQLYISSDYGATWTAKESDRWWMGVAISGTYLTSNGRYQTAVAGGGKIYVSSDYGATWTAKDSDRNWTAVALSTSGQYQSACVSGGKIYISSDYGATWTAKDSNRGWLDISMDGTGQYQTASAGASDKIYISGDYGATWEAMNVVSGQWYSAAFSRNKMRHSAVAYDIYTSKSPFGTDTTLTAFKGVLHKNRVWIICKNNTMKAYASAFESYEDFTTVAAGTGSSYIDFTHVLDGADELMDVVSYIDLLVFFFKNNIAIYSGSDPTSNGDFALVQVIKGLGVVGTDCTQRMGSDLVFLSQNGLKSLKRATTTGDLTTGELSSNIDMLSESNPNSVFSSCHYPSKSHLLFLIGTTVWVFNYKFEAWHKLTGADVYAMFQTSDGSVYFVGAHDVYKYGDAEGWNGANSTMVWETAWIHAKGKVIIPKELVIEKMAVASDSTTLQVEQFFGDTYEGEALEGGSPAFTDNSESYQVASDVEKAVIPLFGRGQKVKFRFTKTSQTSCEIKSLELRYVLGDK